MADHNIYIHAIGGTGSEQSPTSPWQNGGAEQTKGEGNGAIPNFIARSAMFLSNPDSLVSSAFSKVATFGIAFASAKIVTSVTLNTLQLVADWHSLYSGDFAPATLISDVRESFNNAFRPISTVIENHRRNVTYRMADTRNSMKLQLLGDSVINSYTNRGI